MESDKSNRNGSDIAANILFAFSLSCLVFAYGYFAHKFQLFPHSFIESAVQGMVKVAQEFTDKRSWMYKPTKATEKIGKYDPYKAYEGLSMTTSLGEDRKMYIRIIDMNGDVIQQWKISWGEIWPNATHLTEAEIPKEDPGTHIHGAVVMENGDVVFNFEHLGLVRLDPCGEVVWRLPYRTHHSVFQDGSGYLWVSSQINHDAADPSIPNYKGAFIEPTLLKVSPQGEVLLEKSVIELLQQNKLHSLLYMVADDDIFMTTGGDTLHLNDVEVFPASMAEGYFKHGDIMISLRNINTILVFDPVTWEVKYKSIGAFLRQHDPDFVDGSTISIYDNNSINQEGGRYSRILLESADDSTITTYFTGSPDKPFFSAIMGKHQWLPNGNLLITDTLAAKAFELDREGEIVWEYTNTLGDGYAGIMEEVTRLPRSFNAEFFSESRSACAGR